MVKDCFKQVFGAKFPRNKFDLDDNSILQSYKIKSDHKTLDPVANIFHVLKALIWNWGISKHEILQ